MGITISRLLIRTATNGLPFGEYHEGMFPCLPAEDEDVEKWTDDVKEIDACIRYRKDDAWN